jgi:hypothetical protein
MLQVISKLRNLLHLSADRLGVLLSALCLLHCLAGLLLVTVLGTGAAFAGVLLDPHVHEYGLVAAIAVGGVGLGVGAMRHGHMRLLAIGTFGLALMALGLVVPHGPAEAAVTALGVSLLAFAHIRNLRHRH